MAEESSSNANQPAAATPAKTQIALYQDKGAGGAGPKMLLKTFTAETEYELVPITAQEILDGKLKDFRVLIVPGGQGLVMGKTLGTSGVEAIRKYVDDGGAYIGICAGCYLASSHFPWSLHILPAKLVDPKNRNRGKANLQLEPTEQGKQWLKRESLEPKSVYHNGPVLMPVPDSSRPFVPLAYFREEQNVKGAKEGLMINTPAIVASSYGKGWVVGVSPHPEQTQGLQDVVPSLVKRVLAEPPPATAPTPMKPTDKPAKAAAK